MSTLALTLYGTLGCHLCEDAQQLVEQFCCARAIKWQQVDIIDLPATEMNALATRIPVLSLQSHSLYWPFTLAEIAQLYNQLNPIPQ